MQINNLGLALIAMALGSFRFGMNHTNYQEFSRKAQFRWVDVERIGREPALQFAGAGSDEITLKGEIWPAHFGGLHTVDEMRAQAGLGIPMHLSTGDGYIWKKWVITSVSETKRFLFSDGSPRQIDFDLTLRAYGEDRA